MQTSYLINYDAEIYKKLLLSTQHVFSTLGYSDLVQGGRDNHDGGCVPMLRFSQADGRQIKGDPKGQ